jgi:hypothetical protein
LYVTPKYSDGTEVWFAAFPYLNRKWQEIRQFILKMFHRIVNHGACCFTDATAYCINLFLRRSLKITLLEIMMMNNIHCKIKIRRVKLVAPQGGGEIKVLSLLLLCF